MPIPSANVTCSFLAKYWFTVNIYSSKVLDSNAFKALFSITAEQTVKRCPFLLIRAAIEFKYCVFRTKSTHYMTQVPMKTAVKIIKTFSPPRCVLKHIEACPSIGTPQTTSWETGGRTGREVNLLLLQSTNFQYQSCQHCQDSGLSAKRNQIKYTSTLVPE